ncbi:major facilitator superfamily MFS_1 [Beutenbergia cavernae DSM 12333]|uniref:Major facilitator superfamily MFS_1 n=2 Tax=Beutenbergia TaxID=84756 RepID=C5C169_BEUC1|nr:major facilitator superfamily MFS_1 [Beutenbergia cavernae DSM 12333]
MRHAPFRRLSLAWITTNLGDSALYLALAVWVKELTGSDGAAGLVFAALGLPALLAPLAGQIADRMSRRRLLVLANLATAVVVLTMFAVRGPGDVWVIYVATFLYGLAGYVTAAAQSGLLRDMLSDDELPGATGMYSTIDQGLRLVSPLLGTGLYALAGPQAVLVLTAACFVVTAMLLLTIRLTETPPQPAHERGGYWHEVSAGFRTLAGESTLRLLTVVIAVAFGITGLLNVAIFPMLEQGIGVGVQALGIAVTVQGLGALVGGLTSAAIVRRIGERRLVGLGLLDMGLGLAFGVLVVLLVPAGHPAGLPLASLALSVVGLGIPWVVVGVSTYRMRVTPATLQGRTSAAMNLSFNGPQTLATLVGAAVIAVVDYRLLLGVCAVVIVACAVACRPLTPDGARPAVP